VSEAAEAAMVAFSYGILSKVEGDSYQFSLTHQIAYSIRDVSV